MGVVWIQKTDGSLIHIPVEGADVNTPDNALDTPVTTGAIQSVNRCWSNSFEYNHPTLGVFTINLMPPNVTGSCNQCGMCCGHPVADCPDSGGECGYILNTDIGWHVCEFLDIKNWRQWPKANLTTCLKYETILDFSKACAYPPDADEIKPWWTLCGFSEVP